MPLIPNIFTNFTSSDINQNTASAADMSAAVSDAGKQAVLDMLDSLSAGDTILGKVTSQSGKEISILTQNGVTINAKNSSMINFEKGSSILFEVQKVAGRDISIRPLYQNTNMQRTAEVALRQAGIPINERSLELTGRNMEYGNPIDRNSLIESYKDAALYPEASVKCIVDLQKMNIDVNPTSISQYQAYLNMENSVTSAFSTIADSMLSDLNNALVLEGSERFAEDPVAALSQNTEVIDELNAVLDRLTESGKAVDGALEDDIKTLINDAHEAGIALPGLEGAENEGRKSYLNILKSVMTDIKEPQAYVPAETTVAEAEISHENESKPVLFNLSKENPLTPETPVNTEIRPDLAEFLNKESVKGLFKKALTSNWSLNVDELKDKAEVRALYDKLFSETKSMMDALSQSSEKFSATREGLMNLRENMEFMHDMNQYVPYIQIPFHNDENSANSELYVFTNKKNFAAGDNELSAFIHLDMEHLGPTDVYVKMRDMNITTNFTMKDEDTLIFMEHHMDFLERRLAEKGFSLETELKVGKDEKSPLEKMLSDNERHLVLTETSFDARV